jgi:hypothetical protein
MTGYRGLSYLFVKSFPVLSQGFEIETEMTIHAVDKNMLIENIVVDYRDRPLGSESKLNTVSDGFKVLKKVLSLLKNYRPMMFFFTVSSVLFVLGVIFVAPVIVTYIKIGLVPRLPTLIFSIFLWLAAILSFFTGLMLDVIRQKNLHDFEMILHELEYRQNVTFISTEGSKK